MDDSDTPPSPLSKLPRIDSLDRLRRVATGRARERISKDYAGLSARDLARMLIKEQKLNQTLEASNSSLTSQLTLESERADTAERRSRDLLLKVKVLNEEKLVAQREAAAAKEELRLYKAQLHNAQQEIFRAQAVLDELEQARVSAEDSAAKARTRARKLREESMVERARQEGRMEGYQEGLRSGRDAGFEDGRFVGYDEGRELSQRAFESALGDALEEETPAALGSIRNLPDPGPDPERESEPMPMPAPPPQPRPPTQYYRRPESPSRTPVPDPRPPMSPRHPENPIPPDNYIPTVSPHDSRIRLPPPHEMSRTPGTPAPPLPPEPEEIRYIPPPATPSAPTYPQNRHGRSETRPPRVRRRSSPDSQSTTISQFGLVNESPQHANMPEPVVMPQPQARETGPGYLRERKDSGLSVIPEVLSGATSPAPSYINRTPEGTQYMPTPMTVPAPQPPPPTSSFQPPTSNYQQSRNSQSTSSEEAGRQSRASRRSSTRRSATPAQAEPARNSVSSGNSVPDITIVPPSRPASNRSLQSQARNLLSPRDAAEPRPLPPIADDEPPAPPSYASARPMPGATPVSMGPIVLPNGQLFTPTEVIPTPAAGNASLPSGPGNTVPFPSGSGSGMPPPAVYMMHEDQGLAEGEKPVIPEGYSAAGRLPGTRRDSSSTSTTTDTQSSGFSNDTLSTPPPRGKKGKTAKKSRASTSASGYTAAGVPLPPSTIGSSTPHTTTSFYAQTPGRGWGANANTNAGAWG